MSGRNRPNLSKPKKKMSTADEFSNRFPVISRRFLRRLVVYQAYCAKSNRPVYFHDAKLKICDSAYNYGGCLAVQNSTVCLLGTADVLRWITGHNRTNHTTHRWEWILTTAKFNRKPMKNPNRKSRIKERRVRWKFTDGNVDVRKHCPTIKYLQTVGIRDVYYHFIIV